MKIKDAVAVITGAAGGIGRALAMELAKREVANLALVDHSETVQQVSKAVNDIAGEALAYSFTGDVTDDNFRKGVYREMSEKCGTVTICVPAAGITRDSLAVKLDKQTRRVSIYPIETFRQVMEVNLVAPIYWALEMVAGVAES